jgi:tRNA pseudouridine38-40 synthase
MSTDAGHDESTSMGDTATDGPVGPSVRVRLLVAYRGDLFHGFAEQPDVPTVAGALRAVLEDVHGAPIELTCAGRTDRGVHAWGQVVTYDAPAARCDLERVQRAVNGRLGPDVVVRAASLVPPGFDARRSAAARTYRYTIWNDPVPNPFLAGVAWHVVEPLDLRVLILGCDALIGEHDYSSFCRTPPPGPDGEARSLVRRVLDARWEAPDPCVLRFEITASAFCHQMVRSITGTLVEMGRGGRRPGEMAGILRARDRHAAGQLAPPDGLCLWHVDYPEAALGFASEAARA